MSDKKELKRLYDKALKEAIKANDASNKVIIDELRVKCEKLRVKNYNSSRSARRLLKHKTTTAKVLINMQLDGELNLSKQQISDRCCLSLQHIRNTFCKVEEERR